MNKKSSTLAIKFDPSLLLILGLVLLLSLYGCWIINYAEVLNKQEVKEQTDPKQHTPK